MTQLSVWLWGPRADAGLLVSGSWVLGLGMWRSSGWCGLSEGHVCCPDEWVHILGMPAWWWMGKRWHNEWEGDLKWSSSVPEGLRVDWALRNAFFSQGESDASLTLGRLSKSSKCLTQTLHYCFCAGILSLWTLCAFESRAAGSQCLGLTRFHWPKLRCPISVP